MDISNTLQVHKDLPAGAEPFSVESLLSIDPVDLNPTKTVPYNRSVVVAKADRVYVFTKYGCKAFLPEPTSWGILAPTEQPPLRFVGRHFWKVMGVEFNASSRGIKAVESFSPYATTAPESWNSFMEFREYGTEFGDQPIVFQGAGEIRIIVEAGKYSGPTPLPPAPYNQFLYKTILSGYSLDAKLYEEMQKEGGTRG